MTAISALPGNTYPSPLQRLQDQLQSEVNSGAISSSDQAALSSSLNDINASLQTGPSNDSSGSTSASPGDLKSKINDLIAGEVSSGKLNSAQASELQGVFKAAFSDGSSGATSAADAAEAGAAVGTRSTHHSHHHGGHGGPPPAGTSSTGSSSGAGSVADILQQFLQSLQNSQSTTSSSYGATGSTNSGGSTSAQALLINYQS